MLLGPSDDWSAAASEKPLEPDVADGPGPSVLLSTSFDWTTSRTIASSNAAPPARTTVSLTVVPFGPRIRSRAASTVRPSRVVPSAEDHIAGQQPGDFAGDPSSGR